MRLLFLPWLEHFSYTESLRSKLRTVLHWGFICMSLIVVLELIKPALHAAHVECIDLTATVSSFVLLVEHLNPFFLVHQVSLIIQACGM